MSYQVLLTPLQPRFATFALLKLAKFHSASHGNVIMFAGKRWAQLADASVPDFFTWAQKTFTAGQLLLCFEYEQRFLVIAWSSAGPECHQVLTANELALWLKTLAGIDGFQPDVYFWSQQESIAELVCRNWADARKFSSWPKHAANCRKLPRIGGRIRHVAQASAWFIGVLLVSVWFLNKGAEVLENPAEQPVYGQYHELTSKAGALAPLLRMDAYLHTLLSTLSGWQVREVDYRDGVLRYSMHREGGQLSDLREFAKQVGLQLSSTGEQTWLFRSVVLPPIITVKNNSNDNNLLPPIEHLQDHLDDAIRLLMPESKLRFQAQQVVSSWRTKTLVIGFEYSFIDDLLTLAEIIDGLPVKALEMKYRVNQNELNGFVSIGIFGAKNR